ncbi:hypothetical protein HMPREF0541_00477 [Lacticaseibacillus rhamnosus ATCC 21052]|nr:hypothetical protein HMPREF0541_00477 [Lacticaseibacillus rhamnosus ATCC 21052]
MGKLSITHTLMRKVHLFVSDRCRNNDHGLRLFVSSLGHWGNPVDQGDDQAASCSKRTHAGARIISRKIGKLKAAIPSLGCRGF